MQALRVIEFVMQFPYLHVHRTNPSKRQSLLHVYITLNHMDVSQGQLNQINLMLDSKVK